MATYQNDPLRLEQTFIDFLHHLPFYGLCVLCIDDPVVRKCLPKINRQQITYGFDEDADWVAHDYHQKGTSCTFTAGCKKEDVLIEVQLNLPGRHNALNALAAIAIAYELGVEQSSVVEALKSFGGIKRRFSILGEFPVEGGHAVIVDDYGHHPREIDATLAAARAAWPDQRIVLVFQPHRYTRTADLFEDFSLTLSKADELLLLDVYPAGEAPIAGADSRDLCRSVRTRGQVDPIFIGELAELRTALNSFLRPNDIVLMQGAGSIGTAALQLVNSK